MEVFDLTPDPKVLVALTHTPMSPLDALCELIDNSLDSFRTSKIRGEMIESPLVLISLPRVAEVDRSIGVLRVRDNGPGMSAEQAEKALRAGFSGNNPYDSLGLFGMGFNISTGKIGRKTRLITAQKADDFAIEVTIDLDTIVAAKSYAVPVNSIKKPDNFDHGTLVEISGWWPEGNANSKFVRRLIQYGVPVLQREVGRRYATVLRGDMRSRGLEARIIVNEQECEAFEHCVWADNRSVEHKTFDKIPAVMRFDSVAGGQVRCLVCTALVTPGRNTCESCGSASLRTIQQHVRGWIGIQRFDDSQSFGIDLVRNGRAIRVSEKGAFFEFTDDLKNTFKDYPIDQQFGRIVGEIHLDHVPVDFLKQDFQRTSPEWADAMRILRGESSLQPRQPNAESNFSPMYKLYQGYRRVRDFGKRDMYMGYWDEAKKGAARISREIEQEYYKKFQAKDPGFYDDAEWWKLVEQADQKPLEALINCPTCNSQNLASAIVCVVCDTILAAKTCINDDCQKEIPANALDCPYCGSPQIIEIKSPWLCKVCGNRNAPGQDHCSQCTFPNGTLNPLDQATLIKKANRNDELSISACTVRLADGSISDPIDVEVWVVSSPMNPWGLSYGLPMHFFAETSLIRIFLDLNHQAFSEFALSPEQMIASQVANVIHRAHGKLTGSHPELHTAPNIAWQIIKDRWATTMNGSVENTRSDAISFFDELRERMGTNLAAIAPDLYEELRDSDKRSLVQSLLDAHIDPTKLGELKQSGKYVLYLTNDTVAYLVKRRTKDFLDGAVWDWRIQVSSELSDTDAKDFTERFVSQLCNWLDDVAQFLQSTNESNEQAKRTRISLLMLRHRLV